MYICERCKHTFEDDEVPSYINDIGFDTEVGHISCKEELIDDCPYCGGEIVEAMECEECGDWMTVDEAELNEMKHWTCKKCQIETLL